MIQNPYLFVSLVVATVFGIKYAERKSKARFFEFIPSIVIIYFTMMLIGNIKLFDAAVVKSFTTLKSYILPAMIFLMLIGSDVKSVYRIKTKLIVSFFITSLAIMAAFVLMWATIGGYFGDGANKAFGSLCGSWIGGTANMVAVASAVGLKGELMGYCLITDSVCYAAWFAFLLFMAPHKDRFNLWTKAEEVKAAPTREKHTQSVKADVYALSAGVVVSVFIAYVSKILPAFSFVTASFWSVVLATVLGILASFTSLSKSLLSEKAGFWLLYFLIALIAVDATFDDFKEAWLFIAAGFFIIATHAVLITIYAKIFRIDLFTIGVASLANIGGVASAPLLAASFSKNLVSVGVVMSMLGYIIGTFCGLLIVYLLGSM